MGLRATTVLFSDSGNGLCENVREYPGTLSVFGTVMEVGDSFHETMWCSPLLQQRTTQFGVEPWGRSWIDIRFGNGKSTRTTDIGEKPSHEGVIVAFPWGRKVSREERRVDCAFTTRREPAL